MLTINKCKVKKTGLILDDNLSFEEWSNIGTQLQVMHGSIGFWIGDWLNFGEKHYRETYTQAINETGLDYSTLSGYKYVTNAIDRSRRRENLSWACHREVASFPPDIQDKLLKQGLDEGWHSRDFARAGKIVLREQKIEEFKKQAANYDNKDIQIFNEPFQEYAKTIADNSIDLILTDPPYPEEFLPLWQDMFEVAERILKPSHFLVAYANHQNLDAIFRLNNKLKYYWTFKLDFTLKPIAMGRNLIATWKPVLIYQKMPFHKFEETIEDNVIEFLNLETNI